MSKLEKNIAELLDNHGIDWRTNQGLAQGIKKLTTSTVVKDIKESYLNTDRVKEATECPICEQNIKVQTVPLSKITCELLIKACRLDAGGKKYFHVDKDLGVPLKVGGGWAELRHWGLIEPQPNPKDSTKSIQGMWNVTVKAMEFIGQKITLPSKVYIYNSNLVSEHREQVSIVEVIGDFDEYANLMSPENSKEEQTYKEPSID